MAELDRAWAADQLERFRKTHRAWVLQEQTLAQMADGFASLARVRTDHISPDELIGDELVLDRILVQVFPAWESPQSRHNEVRWGQYSEAATRAIPLLRRSEELRAKLGDGAPMLDAGRLHRWVWEGARSLWRSGHYREAVGAVARQLNAETQNKLSRRDVSEEALFKEAFSTADPAAGKARLRLGEDDGNRTFTSKQRGAMALAEGLFAAVRNPASHDVLEELPEHEALEQLAAFSVLARWVDRAQVITAAPDSAT